MCSVYFETLSKNKQTVTNNKSSRMPGHTQILPILSEDTENW